MPPMSDSLGHTLGTTRSPQRKPSETRTQPMLVIGLECDRPLASSTRHALGDVHVVRIGRGRERRARREGGTLFLEIPDRWMSSSHARLSQSFGRWVLEDSQSKNGSLVNGYAVTRHTLQDGDVIELGHTLLLYADAAPL